MTQTEIRTNQTARERILGDFSDHATSDTATTMAKAVAGKEVDCVASGVTRVKLRDDRHLAIRVQDLQRYLTTVTMLQVQAGSRHG